MSYHSVEEKLVRYKQHRHEIEKEIASAVDAVVYEEVGIGEMFDVEFEKNPDDEGITDAVVFKVRHGGKKRLRFERGCTSVEWFGFDVVTEKDGWQQSGTNKPYVDRFRGYLMCLFRGDKEHFKGLF